MALTRSPGVRGETGLNGPTPLDMRRALEALAGGPYPGVISGCTVTGTASWEYAVAAGWLATQRSATDGLNVWSVDGSETITQADDGSSLVAPGSGSRVDIVYALHHDIDQGDADSLPVVAVVKGTASGSPSAPALPSGAIELARKVVAAGDTSTSVGAAISHANRNLAGVRVLGPGEIFTSMDSGLSPGSLDVAVITRPGGAAPIVSMTIHVIGLSVSAGSQNVLIGTLNSALAPRALAPMLGFFPNGSVTATISSSGEVRARWASEANPSDTKYFSVTYPLS